MLLNGFVVPSANVATAEMGATVLTGDYPLEMLNGNTKTYGRGKGYTCHGFGEEILIKLGQPYRIQTMRLLLWDLDDQAYRFYIETSLDKENWQIAIDRRTEDSRSWQTLTFEQRLCVYIKIVGTRRNAANYVRIFEFFQIIIFSTSTVNARKTD